MFKVGDRVAVIHLHRVGKERRREAIRADVVEKKVRQLGPLTSGECLTAARPHPSDPPLS